MKKLVVVTTLVFLLLSCGPSWQEKYDALFEGDNPLIGTWESEGQTFDGSTGKEITNDQIVFIDDSTMYFRYYYNNPENEVIYTYAFDKTGTVSNIYHNFFDEPARYYNIFRDNDVIYFAYIPHKKIIVYYSFIYTKIKK